MAKILLLSDDKIKLLEKLWSVYGNRGPHSTMANHKFIQTILEMNEDCRELFNPSDDCIKAVDDIINAEGPNKISQ